MKEITCKTPIHISKMRGWCDICKNRMEKYQKISFEVYHVNSKKFVYKEVRIYECIKCGELHIYYENYNSLKKNYIVFQNFILNKKPLGYLDVDTFKRNLANNKFERIGEKDYLVRNDDIKCSLDGYIIEDIDGTVNVLTASGNIESVKIPVGKCLACGNLYLHEREYRKLKEQGIILCRIEKAISESNLFKGRPMKWNKESLLHSYGYNVNSTEGLSEEQRHKVLEMILANGLLTRFEMIDQIEFLINLNKGKDCFSLAIKKWQDDIEFLNNLKTEDIKVQNIMELHVVKHMKKECR